MANRPASVIIFTPQSHLIPTGASVGIGDEVVPAPAERRTSPPAVTIGPAEATFPYPGEAVLHRSRDAALDLGIEYSPLK